MTQYIPSRDDPGIIEWRQRCRNSMNASAGIVNRLAGATAYMGARRKRMLFWQMMGFGFSSYNTSGSGTRGAFAFRTGYYTTKVVIRVFYIQNATTSGTPYCYVDYGTPNGSLTSTSGPNGTVYHPRGTGGTPPLTSIGSGKIVIDVTENTLYEMRLVTVGAFNVMGVCAYEVVDIPFDSGTRKMDPSEATVGGEIHDENLGELGSAIYNIRQRNRKMLFGYSGVGSNTADVLSAPFTETSTTFTNIIDGASTSVSTTTPGHLVDVTYDGLETDTSVDISVYVLGKSDINAEGEVIITDGGAGGLSGTVGHSGFTTSWAWVNWVTTLTAGAHKIDVHAKSTGGNTTSIAAWWAWVED